MLAKLNLMTFIPGLYEMTNSECRESTGVTGDLSRVLTYSLLYNLYQINLASVQTTPLGGSHTPRNVTPSSSKYKHTNICHNLEVA